MNPCSSSALDPENGLESYGGIQKTIAPRLQKKCIFCEFSAIPASIPIRRKALKGLQSIGYGPMDPMLRLQQRQ